MKTGYKVLDNKLCSATISGEGAVQYIVNEKVYPKDGCGPLCVFPDLDTAIEFHRVGGVPFDLIYTCDYVESPVRSVWTPLHERCKVSEIQTGTETAIWVMIKEEAPHHLSYKGVKVYNA